MEGQGASLESAATHREPMFSFFKKKTPPPAPAPASEAAPASTVLPEPTSAPAPTAADAAPPVHAEPAAATAPQPSPERRSWLDKLKTGLRKTGSSITQVFTGTKIDDTLYEELEAALLMADTGVKATEFLLGDLKRRVKDS